MKSAREWAREMNVGSYETIERDVERIQEDARAPDRGTLMNRKATAGARLVEARDALALVKPTNAAAYERARVRLEQAKAEFEAVTQALDAAETTHP